MADPQYSGLWPRIRVQVLDRDRYSCQIKGPGCTIDATCVDHIISTNNGGAWWDPANCRAACTPCNTWRANTERHNRPSRQWR